MPLKSNQEAILESKEPIVLDTEGNPIYVPIATNHFRSENAQFKSTLRTFQLSGWRIVPLFFLGTGAFLLLGGFFLSFFVAGALLWMLVRFFIRVFGFPKP